MQSMSGTLFKQHFTFYSTSSRGSVFEVFIPEMPLNDYAPALTKQDPYIQNVSQGEMFK